MPVTFARLFRGESRAGFRPVGSHLLEVFAPSFFVPGENYFDSKSGSSGSSTHTVIKLRGLLLKYSIQYAGIKLI